jgi:L-amino acid N-acyltransferase YncA
MNPMNIEIRLAEEKDLPHILEIYAPYITQSKISMEYTVPELDEFVERYRNITQFFPWIVCLINNEIIGYA